MTCKKDRSKLIFTRFDGKVAVYDLADNSCTSPTGRKVKDLKTFFRGVYFGDITFEDEAYRKFVNSINQSEGRVRNVGTMLERLYKYRHNESYFLLGINVRGARQYPVSHYPKAVMKFIRATNNVWRMDQWFRFFGEDEDKKKAQLLQSMVQLEDEINFFGNIDVYYFRSLLDMHTAYNMDYKSMLLQINNYIRREGLTFQNTVTNLRDYNSMASKMSTKYQKYPKYLLSTHAIVNKNYQAFKEYYDEMEFKKKVNTKLAHKGVSYSIVVPESGKDVQNEGAEQHHCVASYVKSIIAGRTQIVFLRKNNEIDKPLITVEVNNGKITQAKGSYNRSIAEDEMKFLGQFAKAKGLTIGNYL